MNKIKLINKLKLRKYRDEMNLFIVEGDKLIEEIPKDWLEFIVTVDEIGEREFKKISELTTPQSAIAVCRKPKVNSECGIRNSELATSESSFLPSSFRKRAVPFGTFGQSKVQITQTSDAECEMRNAELTIVLDRIQDPNNVGAILRTTAAAGLKNIILLEGTADCFNPKSIRASMGAIFHLNLVTMTEEELINSKLKLIAAHIEGVDYRSFKLPKNSALILGNEGQGVSKSLLEISEQITIPIQNVESLNVNAAAAILIFHFA